MKKKTKRRLGKKKQKACETGLVDATLRTISHLRAVIRELEESIYEHYPSEINSSQDIGVLGLQLRIFNCLRKSNIKTLADLVEYSRDDLYDLRGLGQDSLNEIESKLLYIDCSS